MRSIQEESRLAPNHLGPGDADGALQPKATATVGAGTNPEAVAVIPDQGPRASSTANAAPAGSGSAFNELASSDPDGTIARYDWNFGDGTVLPSGNSTPVHTYAAPGTYTVTLTVTDDVGQTKTTSSTVTVT